MPITLPLNEADSIVLDGSGNGTLAMRPDGSREYWLPTMVSEAAPNPAGGIPAHEARFDLYIGYKVGSQYFVDGTYTGSSGNSTDKVAGYTIGRHADPQIIGVWTGGDPGAVATMRVQGTKELR